MIPRAYIRHVCPNHCRIVGMLYWFTIWHHLSYWESALLINLRISLYAFKLGVIKDLLNCLWSFIDLFNHLCVYNEILEIYFVVSKCFPFWSYALLSRWCTQLSLYLIYFTLIMVYAVRSCLVNLAASCLYYCHNDIDCDYFVMFRRFVHLFKILLECWWKGFIVFSWFSSYNWVCS